LEELRPVGGSFAGHFGVGTAALVVILVIGAAACTPKPDVHVDGPQVLAFGGRQYFAASPSGLSIPAAAVRKVGTATSFVNRSPTIVGDEVYALTGVAPEVVVVMQSSEAGKPYLLFIATDALSGSEPPGELARTVPGICQYLPSEPGCNGPSPS